MARKIEVVDNFRQVLSGLKKGAYEPVYLLTGEEPFFIDALVEQVTGHILDDAQKEFDQTMVYGRDTNPDDLVGTAKRFPMMGERQVVVLREAQEMRGLDALLPYFEAPVQSTLLVVAYKKKMDKRSKLWKAASKQGVAFRADPVRDYQIPQWLGEYVKEQGMDIDPKAAALLADHLGNDLHRIANELKKLSLVLPEGSTVTTKEIEDNIGISKDFNIFELQEALGKKDVYRANQIVEHFAANPKEHPLVKELYGLYNYFTKLLRFHMLPANQRRNEKEAAAVLKVHPFFVKRFAQASKQYSKGKLVSIVGLLREYDKKGKGMGNVSANDGALMKEMVYRILH